MATVNGAPIDDPDVQEIVSDPTAKPGLSMDAASRTAQGLGYPAIGTAQGAAKAVAASSGKQATVAAGQAGGAAAKVKAAKTAAEKVVARKAAKTAATKASAATARAGMATRTATGLSSASTLLGAPILEGLIEGATGQSSIGGKPSNLDDARALGATPKVDILGMDVKPNSPLGLVSSLTKSAIEMLRGVGDVAVGAPNRFAFEAIKGLPKWAMGEKGAFEPALDIYRGYAPNFAQGADGTLRYNRYGGNIDPKQSAMMRAEAGDLQPWEQEMYDAGDYSFQEAYRGQNATRDPYAEFLQKNQGLKNERALATKGVLNNVTVDALNAGSAFSANPQAPAGAPQSGPMAAPQPGPADAVGLQGAPNATAPVATPAGALPISGPVMDPNRPDLRPTIGPEAVAQRSMGPATTTVIPGAAGFGRWTTPDQGPISKYNMFSNDPNVDPLAQMQATEPQSSITVQNSDIQAVQDRKLGLDPSKGMITPEMRRRAIEQNRYSPAQKLAGAMSRLPVGSMDGTLRADEGDVFNASQQRMRTGRTNEAMRANEATHENLMSSDPAYAYRFSMAQNYARLTPAEKQVMADAQRTGNPATVARAEQIKQERVIGPATAYSQQVAKNQQRQQAPRSGISAAEKREFDMKDAIANLDLKIKEFQQTGKESVLGAFDKEIAGYQEDRRKYFEIYTKPRDKMETDEEYKARRDQARERINQLDTLLDGPYDPETQRRSGGAIEQRRNLVLGNGKSEKKPEAQEKPEDKTKKKPEAAKKPEPKKK